VFKKIKSLQWKLSWFASNYKKLSPDYILIPNRFQGPIKFISDGVATSNNCDFLSDPRFAKAYQFAAATSPWKGFEMQWRTYVVCSLAEIVKHLPGDFVECGVNTGAYSRAVIDYIDFNKTGKTFYLLDTYEGLVPGQISEKEKQAGVGDYLSTYKNVYDQVVATFAPFRTKIIKGAVPHTLPQCDTNQICYLSIDMNVVEPEIAAANYFWDKVVSGGVIILDDYGFPAHIEQKKAFDRFAKEKGVTLLYIPTGQAIIFKP
jgi:O-methyltransferase